MSRWSLCLFLGACNTAPVRAMYATEAVLNELALEGDAVDARPGDVVLRSSKLIAVVQRPGRDIGPVPYGGNVIDLALTDDRIDRFGETQPLYNLGRTAAFEAVEIIRDGSDGGAVEVEARGRDALWDFINLPAIDPGLLAYRPGGLLPLDPNAPVPVRIRARYILEPDADALHVRYVFENESDERLSLQAAYAMDTGGAMQFFIPGRGFGTPFSSFDLSALSGGITSTPFVALVGDDVAYLFRALSSAGSLEEALGLSVAGVGIVVTGRGNFLDVVGAANMELPARAKKQLDFEIQVARSLAEAQARVLVRDGVATAKLSGVVHGGARRPEGSDVMLLDAAGVVVMSTRLAADDSFGFEVSPGQYRVLVDVDGPSLESAMLDLVAGETLDVVLEAAQPGRVRVEGFDGPCRVSIFSEAVLARDPTRYRRELNERTVLDRNLRHCSGEDIALPAGTYTVQVSAGPLMTWAREAVTLTADGAQTVTAALEPIARGSAVVAADFHQHSVGSPDSLVPLAARALGYAAEGIDFFVSSDHDRLTDYAPVISELGLELGTAIGVETTTLTYGHFNGWPLPFDPRSPSGGAIDWAHETTALLPREIFAAFRQRGAAVVQVNHPRDVGSPLFQSYFDRSGLSVDPDAGVLGGDPLLQPVSNALLRVPSDEPLWDPGFDTMEILNGFNVARAELVLRDWCGFLAMGLAPTVLGVSDSHDRFRSLPGYPRTYVQAEANVEAIASAVRSGRAVASNGPLLSVAIGAFGPGALVPASGDVTLDVRVDANQQGAVDRVDVFMNNWVKVPGSDPLTPAKSQAIALAPVALTGGGTSYSASTRFVLRPNADAFVIVRAIGSAPLAPFLPRVNAPGHAIANAIFLDVDGNGAYDPPRPRLQRSMR